MGLMGSVPAVLQTVVTGGGGTAGGAAAGGAAGGAAVVPGTVVATAPAVMAPAMMAMSGLLPGVALGILKAILIGKFLSFMLKIINVNMFNHKWLAAANCVSLQ